MSKFTKIFLFFSVFVTILYSSTNFVHAETLFEEDFSNKSLDNWTFIRNNCAVPNLSTEKLIFDINNYDCNAELVPNNFNLGINENNYIYQADVYINYPYVYDGKFVFKYKDPLNFYWVQVYENGVFINKMVNGNGVGLTGWHPSFPKDEDSIYRFRIEYKIVNETRSISLYINNFPVAIDVNDPAPHLEGTNIAIGVSTGGHPTLYTWFDNILVTDLEGVPPLTPTPTPPTPVIFIPGLGGSFSFKSLFLNQENADDWTITPGASVYKNIQEVFDDNLYIFLYDWRKPTLTYNAQRLNDFIKNTVKPEGGKVNLIGHCLGGLVARACVQITENNCYAKNLITLGAPHLGVVDVYPILEGGEIWRKGLYKLALETLIHYHQHPTETKKDTIARLAPSISDLLPQFDYLHKEGVILPWSQISVKNSLLPYLSDVSRLKNRLNVIYGTGYETLRSLEVVNPNKLESALGYWPDGKPVEKYVSTDGDKTILSLSSSFQEENIDNFQFNLDHNGIVSQKAAINKMLEILGNNLTENDYQGLSEEENYLVFFVHSPVEISINEVDHNYIFENELIIIPNPENKKYILQAMGLENTEYSLSVGQIFGETVFWNDYVLEAKKDVAKNYEFLINPNKPSDNPLVETEDYPISYLIKKINMYKEEIESLDISLAEKKVIIKFIEKIKSNLDNPKMAFQYSLLVRNKIISSQISKTINIEKIVELINKSLEIHSLLETLLLNQQNKCNKQKAQGFIDEATKVKNETAEIIDSRNAGLIFLIAEEKLNRAITNFGYGNYCEAEIFAKSAREIFLDSKRLNNISRYK